MTYEPTPGLVRVGADVLHGLWTDGDDEHAVSDSKVILAAVGPLIWHDGYAAAKAEWSEMDNDWEKRSYEQGRRDALNEAYDRHRTQHHNEHTCPEDDWMTCHETAIRRDALNDAADALQPDEPLGVNQFYSEWLRARAAPTWLRARAGENT